MRTPRTLVTTLLVALVAVPTVALAGADDRPDGEPRVVVTALSTEVAAAAAEETDHPTMIARIRKGLDGAVDYEGFARRTLKSSWADLSAPERERFQVSFMELISRTYAKRFKPGTRFTVAPRGETEWKGEARRVGMVKTTLSSEKITADVDYRFEPATVDGKRVWRCTDIVIDGVSMALNWRRQFKRVIDKDGFEALVTKIEQKVAQLKAAEAEK